jgi:glycerol uptake facilitator protein
MFSFLAGWGTAAMPGPNGSGFFTVYILAPIVGAVVGGGVWEYVLLPAFAGAEKK